MWTAVSRRGAGRRALRAVHAWIGLALSLLFLVFAITGGALVYKEAYWRLVYPELREPAAAGVDAVGRAAAIAAASTSFGDALRSVKMPEPGVYGYHLYLNGGEAFLSIGDHRVIDAWVPSERLMSFLFDLHAHLMAGDAGERVGGVIALLGVLLSATGLILWWPTRRQFAIANLFPRELSRRRLLLWHRDLGAVTSPLILVVLLSGSALVFYESARTLMNGLFGDAVPAAAATPPTAAHPAAAETSPPSGGPVLADAAMLARVDSVFPNSRIVFYYPPPEGVALHEFRLKQPCELHPNGRSYVYLSLAGHVVGKTDACVLPPGERVVHAAYPLHAGKAGSASYRLAVLVSAVVLAILSLSGAITYMERLGWVVRR